MPVGRKFVVKKNDTKLAGVRSKTFTYSGEPIDETSDDDSGRRKLADATGQQQIDMSVEGVLKGSTLRDIALDLEQSNMLTDITLEFPLLDPVNTTAAMLSGNFFMTNFEETGEYNGEITFTTQLQSSGPWTYTPEAV